MTNVYKLKNCKGEVIFIGVVKLSNDDYRFNVEECLVSDLNEDEKDMLIEDMVELLQKLNERI